MKEAKAILRNLRIGPRKVRLIAGLIRGRRLIDALDRLSLINKKSARPVYKLLKSAAANAKNIHSLEEENLRVKTIFVDGGPMMKRWMPRAHGRATPIRQRLCHITLILEEVAAAKEKKDKKAKKAGKKEKTKK